eukprot:763421-Hanusia_phi.AAC.2
MEFLIKKSEPNNWGPGSVWFCDSKKERASGVSFHDLLTSWHAGLYGRGDLRARTRVPGEACGGRKRQEE